MDTGMALSGLASSNAFSAEFKRYFLQRICTIFHNRYPAAVAPIKEIKSISTYVPNAVPTTLPDHELRSHPSGIPASFTISPNNDTDKGVILSGF